MGCFGRQAGRAEIGVRAAGLEGAELEFCCARLLLPYREQSVDRLDCRDPLGIVFVGRQLCRYDRSIPSLDGIAFVSRDGERSGSRRK